MKYALLAGSALAALAIAPGALPVIAQEAADTPLAIVGTPQGDQAEPNVLAATMDAEGRLIVEAGEDGEIALPADQFAAQFGPISEADGQAVIEDGGEGSIVRWVGHLAAMFGLDGAADGEPVINGGVDGEIEQPADQVAALSPPMASQDAAKVQAGLTFEGAKPTPRGSRLDRLAAAPLSQADEPNLFGSINLEELATELMADWDQPLTPKQRVALSNRCEEMRTNDPDDDPLRGFCDSWASADATPATIRQETLEEKLSRH